MCDLYVSNNASFRSRRMGCVYVKDSYSFDNMADETTISEEAMGLRLHEAIVRDNSTVIDEIIRGGYDVNKELVVRVKPTRENRLITSHDVHPTPLHVACIYRRPHAMEQLLRLGKSDPNKRDRLQRTPVMLVLLYWPRMMYASETDGYSDEELQYQQHLLRMHQKSQKCLQILCDHGADMRETVYRLNQSYLHLAATYNIPLAVEVLVRHGADQNAVDEEGKTPLMVSCQWNNYEACMELLEHHANPRSRNSSTGRTPLHYASGGSTRGDNLKMVKLLVRYGASVNAADTEFGNTPLHIAANTGRESEIDFLLLEGADPHITNTLGQTPLFCYLNCHGNEKKIYGLQRLLDDTLQVNVLDSTGHLPGRLSLLWPGHKTLRAYLLNATVNPPSLQHICRHVIRRAMGLKNVRFRNVDTLPWPGRLKDFILFSPVIPDS